MNTLFIYDPTQPLNKQSRCYSTMTAKEGTPTHVDYSGALYNNNNGNFTLEEYKTFKNNPNLIAVPFDEFNTKVLIPYHESLCGEFTEITEEKYWDALECLPPMKWHDLDSNFNVFFISEAYTASIHSCFIKDKKNKKYYTAMRDIFISDEVLLNQIVSTIK